MLPAGSEVRINMGSSSDHVLPMDCTACSSEFEALLLASPETRAWWASLRRKTLARGDTLLRAADTPSHAWRIQRGLMRIYYLSPSGTERNRSFHAEGQWVGGGVPLLVEQRPSPYCIEALESTEVVCVPLEELRQRCSSEPRAAAAMQEVAAWNLERQSRREAELLLMSATQRYRSVMDELGGLADRIPLVHIASHIGITNVALSRLRRHERAAGGSFRQRQSGSVRGGGSMPRRMRG